MEGGEFPLLNTILKTVPSSDEQHEGDILVSDPSAISMVQFLEKHQHEAVRSATGNAVSPASNAQAISQISNTLAMLQESIEQNKTLFSNQFALLSAQQSQQPGAFCVPQGHNIYTPQELRTAVSPQGVVAAHEIQDLRRVSIRTSAPSSSSSSSSTITSKQLKRKARMSLQDDDSSAICVSPKR